MGGGFSYVGMWILYKPLKRLRCNGYLFLTPDLSRGLMRLTQPTKPFQWFTLWLSGPVRMKPGGTIAPNERLRHKP